MGGLRAWLARTGLRKLVVNRRHRGLDAGDVFIASYPRSGNTWLRFLLYEALSGNEPDFASVDRCVPDVGGQQHATRLLANGGRLLKTHEPYRDEYKNVIYLLRDPRDVLVSEFEYQRWRGDGVDDFDQFLERFLHGKANHYGPWDRHVTSYSEAAGRDAARIYRLRYEDLRRDTGKALAELLSFLGAGMDEARTMRVVLDNDLLAMQRKEVREMKRPEQAERRGLRFVRTGAVEGWKQLLNEERLEAFNQRFGESLVSYGYGELSGSTQRG
jgi:hypothetical protein